MIRRFASLRSTWILTLALGLICFLTGSAQAQFVNGSFETGDFTGWTTTGLTSTQTSAFGVTPPNGTFQALGTTNFSTPNATLESFFGVSAGAFGALNTHSSTSATEGSGIQQTITATAGSTISFSWNHLTNELQNDPTFDDLSFVVINGTATLLADSWATTVAGPSGYARQTGYQTFSFTVPTTGTYNVGVGVVDMNDTFVDSGLLVDNFVLTGTGVPEPTTVALVGLAGSAVLAWGWRKHRKQKLDRV